MKNKVLAYCRSQGLIAPGDRVTCAVSGGKDSVVMLHLLHSMQTELGITLAAAHFNHCLRGESSDRDEQFVRQLCNAWNIPLTVGRGDVTARVRKTGESIEEAARALRYDFFDSLGDTVATAHTADDDLETVLLNLLRGTGLTGLCGIPPRRGAFIRPLLCLTRAEIDAYLSDHHLSYVEDGSNAADDYRRNRLRHHVLPLLKEENPALSETVLRMTQLLQADNDYLNDQTASALAAARNIDGSYSCAALAALPEALKSRCVRSILQTIHAPKLTAEHIGAVETLLTADSPSARLDLPGGWQARREYDRLLLENTPEPTSFSPVLLKDGVTTIPELGLTVRCKRGVMPPILPSGCIAVNDSGLPFMLRPRQPGDEIKLPGGSRSLKKLFIDKKIPAARRGLVPVLADENGVAAVFGIGTNIDRIAKPGEAVRMIYIEKEEA